MKIAQTLMVGVGGAFLLLGAGSMAEAKTSYQGNDHTYDTSSRKAAVTCDKESDSTKVKGVIGFTSGSAYDLKDTDGNNSSCASAGSGAFGNRTILKHKTCEYRSAWPDECGTTQSY